MAFKNDESFLAMLEKTADDEPVFLLVGRDTFGSGTVAEWCKKVVAHNASGASRRVPMAKLSGAIDCAAAMVDYAGFHGKVPD